MTTVDRDPGQREAEQRDIESAVRASLARRVGDERFQLWFTGETRLRVRTGLLTVLTPNRFLQDWLRSQFRDDLEAAAHDVLGFRPRVEFRVHEAPARTAEQDPSSGSGAAPSNSKRRASRTSQSPKAATTSQPSSSLDSSGGASAAHSRETRSATPGDLSTGKTTLRRSSQQPVRPAAPREKPPRKWAELETFVVGDSNKIAATSAEIAARRPGSVTPLFVHGPTGVGKTHLLEGIRTAARRANPRVHAVYLTAEQFTGDFQEALSGRGMPLFRRKYRGVDLLLVDDVQYFTGKRATLVELQYTLDTLLTEGKQLVLSADRPPGRLEGLSPELVTRLSGGMVCGIEPPEQETRRGIVDGLCQRLEVAVPDDVRALVANQIVGDARQLAGALSRLQVTSLAHNRPVDAAMAEEALVDLRQNRPSLYGLPDIQRAVSDALGISSESLRSGRRDRQVRHSRMLAMWLARQYTRAGLSEIGRYFGCKSHSTVITAQRQIESWLAGKAELRGCDRDWNIQEAIRRVEAALRSA